MARERGEGEESGDELTTIFQIALIFILVLIGRELGSIYGTYTETSRLSIILQVEEEELARFMGGALTGSQTELLVGMSFTLPMAVNVQGPVTRLPDYARRWLISLVLSPVVVYQPQASDVEVQLWVEGELVGAETFKFERENVPYLRLMNRTMALSVGDTSRFSRIVEEASERYAGEVEIRLTGRALTHVVFFDSWLPFSTTLYPLARAPHVDYVSSRWTDADGRTITRMRPGQTAHVSVELQNPARVHSIWENVTATFYAMGSEEPVLSVRKTTAVAAGSKATYIFPFSTERPGTYYYVLEAPGAFAVREDATKLEVERPTP